MIEAQLLTIEFTRTNATGDTLPLVRLLCLFTVFDQGQVVVLVEQKPLTCDQNLANSKHIADDVVKWSGQQHESGNFL